MSAIPWVSMSYRLTHKNKPKDQLGLSSANYNIAQHDSIPLKAVIYLATKSIVEFYLESTDMTTAEINEQLEAAVKYLQGCKVTQDEPASEVQHGEVSE